MSNKTTGEKASDAFKKIKQAVQGGLKNLETVTTPKSNTDAFLEMIGMDKKSRNAYVEKIKLYFAFFVAISIGLSLLFVASMIVISIINGFSAFCIYGKDDIGLSGSGRILTVLFSSFTDYFYGSPESPGISFRILYSVMGNPSFQMVKTLLIIIAIIFIGFGYMVGTIDFKMHDIVKLLLKLAFIAFVTDSKSMWFIQKVITNPFYHTVDYIALVAQKIIIEASMSTVGVGLPQDLVDYYNQSFSSGKFDPIDLFDRMITIIFSEPFFYKLVGMFGDNFFNVFLITLSLPLFYYLFVIILKIVVQLLSMKIIMSIAMSFFPIFACLFLFKTTQKSAVTYFEDGLIEPAFTYIFTVMFVSISSSLCLRFLVKMFEFQLCLNSVSLQDIIDPAYIFQFVFLFLLCPPLLALSFFPTYKAVDFNQITYIENGFYLMLALYITSENLDGIVDIVVKFANSFNMGMNTQRKRPDAAGGLMGASTRLAQTAAGYADGIGDSVLGKRTVTKDGGFKVEGGLLNFIDAAVIRSASPNSKSSLANYVHGGGGMAKSFINSVDSLTSAISNTYQRIGSNQGDLKSVVLSLLGTGFGGTAAIKHFGGSKFAVNGFGGSLFEIQKNSLFANKEEMKDLRNYYNSKLSKFKEDNGFKSGDILSGNNLVRFKNYFIKASKDGGAPEQTASDMFNFFTFLSKENQKGKEVSVFNDFSTKNIVAKNFNDFVAQYKDAYSKMITGNTGDRMCNAFLDETLKVQPLKYDEAVSLTNNTDFKIIDKMLEQQKQDLQKISQEVDRAAGDNELKRTRIQEMENDYLKRFEQSFQLKTQFNQNSILQEYFENRHLYYSSQDKQGLSQIIIDTNNKLNEIYDKKHKLLQDKLGAINNKDNDMVKFIEKQQKDLVADLKITSMEKDVAIQTLSNLDIRNVIHRFTKDNNQLQKENENLQPQDAISQQAALIAEQNKSYLKNKEKAFELEQKIQEYVNKKSEILR